MTSNPRRMLLLETSNQPGHVGLAVGDRLVGRAALESGRHHARDLAPAMARLIAEQGWAVSELDAVAVGRGPGSYTGLRVGIMSAKTMAYVTGRPLVAIDTFAILAGQTPAECRRIDIIADAQKDSVYVQSFGRIGESWESTCDLHILPLGDWLARRDPASWVGGPGLTRYRERLPDLTVAPTECWSPTLESLLVLATKKLDAGQHDDPFALEPLYLRASSAELQWRDRTTRTPS